MSDIAFNDPSYGSASIQPTAKKISSVAVADDCTFSLSDNPDFVTLHKVTGCFNSVIQIASHYSLALFHREWSPPSIEAVIPYEAIVRTRDSQERPFESETLTDLLANPRPSGSYKIRARLKPYYITFNSGQNVNIKYHAKFSLVSTESVISPSREGRTITYVPRKWITMKPAREVASAYLGNLLLSLDATYHHELDITTKQVDVFADMTHPSITVGEPTGDLACFFDDVVAEELSTALNALLYTRRIALTPTLSLVGNNPFNASVDEFAECEVSVFHVNSGQRQAITAAVNVMPGNRGFEEEVQHFIGAKDYGVISDEYLVERVLKHKWSRGGFPREIGWKTLTTVKVSDEDGNERFENALLHGVLKLDSLELVLIETNSNTRVDCISLAGRASAVPTWMWIYLGGSNQAVAMDPEEVEFGDEGTAWKVCTFLTSHPELSDDIATREFQIGVWEDGFQHVAKPFANCSEQARSGAAIRQVYFRIEGVTKQVFILGEINALFV